MHATWGHELCSFVLTCKCILLWIDVICARYLRPVFQSLKLKDWNSLNVVQLAGFIVKKPGFSEPPLWNIPQATSYKYLGLRR